ncbi:TPA: hypothetical protein NJ311_003623 [Vibrio parahaemolyticus]|nr:hypothetical protein [Vibrio parahaemolyticus]
MKTNKQVMVSTETTLYIHKSAAVRLSAKTKFFVTFLLNKTTKLSPDKLSAILNDTIKREGFKLRFPARSTYSIHKNKYIDKFNYNFKKISNDIYTIEIDSDGNININTGSSDKTDFILIKIKYKSETTINEDNIKFIKTITDIVTPQNRKPYKSSFRHEKQEPNRHRKYYQSNTINLLSKILKSTKLLHNISSYRGSEKKLYRKYIDKGFNERAPKDTTAHSLLRVDYVNEYTNEIDTVFLLLIRTNNKHVITAIIKDEDTVSKIINSSPKEPEKEVKIKTKNNKEFIFINNTKVKKLSTVEVRWLDLSTTTNGEILIPSINEETLSFHGRLFIKGKYANKKDTLQYLSQLERNLANMNMD